jgi:hypothetical protein
MKFGESQVRESTEIEIHGVLQKRNRKGFYQNRYLRTCGWQLQYWPSSQFFSENRTNPSSSYDIREIRIIEATGDCKFYIQFMNEKFKLDLKAISNEQCQEWVEFIRAKKNLHSPNSLLDLDNSDSTFKTKTFGALIKLPLTEQVQ